MQLYDTKAQMRLKKFDLVGFATNTEYSTTILYAEKRSEADQAKPTEALRRSLEKPELGSSEMFNLLTVHFLMASELHTW